MTLDRRDVVVLVAAHLAFVVGVIHVTLGVLNWAKWLGVGFLLPRDIRWPLFVVSGLAILVGLPLANRLIDRRMIYVAGIVLMIGYIVGYFGWHLGGHRPLFLVGPGTHHQGPFLQSLVDHTFAGPVETLSLAAEGSLVVLLAYLSSPKWPDGHHTDRGRGDTVRGVRGYP